MKAAFTAFAAGLVFAVGLAIAGMTRPAKVIAFLDIGGRWDPSLLFVIAAAVAVFLPVHRWSRRRAHPLLAPAFREPTRRRIDARLLAGSAIFGLGWGASGYCPGPAVASLGTGAAGVLAFLAAMLAGMWLVRGGRGDTRHDRHGA
jgi:uncharacterized protein